MMCWFHIFKIASVFSLIFGSTAFAEILAARTLRVGVIVEKADLDISDPEIPTSEFVGKEVKKSIYVGRRISKSDLGPVTVVDRNEVIRLFYSLNGLGIRTEARALEAGGVGEEISVMNISTRVTVRALIMGEKRARVTR